MMGRGFYGPLPAGLLLLLWASATMAVPVTPLPTADHKSPTTGHELRTEFSYTVTLERLPEGAKTLELWLPAPSNDAWQRVESLKVEGVSNYRITKERQYGNRMAYIKLNAAQLPLTVTERFIVDRKEMQVLEPERHISVNGKSYYIDRSWPVLSIGNKTMIGVKTSGKLRQTKDADQPPIPSEPYIPTGGRFKTEAEEIIGGVTHDPSTLVRARALYEHVVATTQYDYKHESPKYAQGDAAFVCDYKKGNCSDLHSYFLSLARSVGIESQLVYGLPVGGVPIPDPLPTEGKIASYHCWVLFRDPKHGWVPMDAADGRRWLDAGSEANKNYDFGNLFVARSAVMVSRGRNLTLMPAQHAEPLNNFIYPYAEVDGKPITAKTEIRYRLLPAL